MSEKLKVGDKLTLSTLDIGNLTYFFEIVHISDNYVTIRPPFTNDTQIVSKSYIKGWMRVVSKAEEVMFATKP